MHQFTFAVPLPLRNCSEFHGARSNEMITTKIAYVMLITVVGCSQEWKAFLEVEHFLDLMGNKGTGSHIALVYRLFGKQRVILE